MARPKSEDKTVLKTLSIPRSIDNALIEYCAKQSAAQGKEIREKDILLSALIIYLKKEGIKFTVPEGVGKLANGAVGE